MRRALGLTALLLMGGCGPAAPDTAAPLGFEERQQPPQVQNKPITSSPFRVLTSGLEGPWEVTWGPDDMLWVTERAGRRVVRIDPQKDPSLRGSVTGADLAEALSRHGVKAEAQGYPTDGQDEGQALMRCAEDCGAGLIVMGAYGHSRLAEFIFGGATRFVLNRLVCPVLMSH